jgi:adenylate cyclase class 2
MRYEVENKYPVAEPSRFESRLAAMNAEIGDEVRQVDTYFAHPARDFASTDEALRIRRVGEANSVTYKGPKIDDTTKTRQEIELAIASGERAAADWMALLVTLGFRVVADVSKRRRPFKVDCGGVTVTGALDYVKGLGTFVELEIVADNGQLADAKKRLIKLARRLELSKPERRSYLELLLEREG